jgi:phosphotransacetylase
MPDYKPTVLFPEAQDPAVLALKEQYGQEDLGVNLRFDDVTIEEAAELLKRGEVDVVIAGVAHDTPTVLRTTIQSISKEAEPERDKRKTITSFFVMEREGEEPIFLADCAVHEYPDADTLVTIAEQTCESVKHLGYDPVVAFLSLSTFGSAAHLESVQKVKQASDEFKTRHPEITAYGEIQADAALNPAIFAKKAQQAGVELVDGKMPNVFVFPDGVSGNITYKMLEQNAGFTAVGPLLDGTYKDIHDSSRGATPAALAREAFYAGQLFKARHQARSNEELPLAA